MMMEMNQDYLTMWGAYDIAALNRPTHCTCTCRCSTPPPLPPRKKVIIYGEHFS